jgi:hypothetical protein
MNRPMSYYIDPLCSTRILVLLSYRCETLPLLHHDNFVNEFVSTILARSHTANRFAWAWKMYGLLLAKRVPVTKQKKGQKNRQSLLSSRIMLVDVF